MQPAYVNWTTDIIAGASFYLLHLTVGQQL